MLSLINLRNRHFLTAVNNLITSLPAGAAVDIESLAVKAAMSHAPAYYCTFDYALRMLRVLRHGRLQLRRGRRFALWTELNTRVTRLMEKRGMRLADALANVLSAGGASQFFISPATAVSLVCRYFDCRTRKLLVPA